jgi:hypothetical protein
MLCGAQCQVGGGLLSATWAPFLYDFCTVSLVLLQGRLLGLQALSLPCAECRHSCDVSGRCLQCVGGRHCRAAVQPHLQTVSASVTAASSFPSTAVACRYVASQPWPFPRSLMVGFDAEAAAAGAGGMDWLSHQGRMAAMDTGLK